VRQLGRQFGAARRDGQPAERPLVDEPQLGAAVGEREPHPQMDFVGSPGRLHQELARHAEMPVHGRAVVQREPEVLAAPRNPEHGPSEQLGDEIERAGDVPADRPRMVHLHRGDRAPGHPFLQAPPHGLDLGQLRHRTPQT
jgi:hypothetical protein